MGRAANPWFHPHDPAHGRSGPLLSGCNGLPVTFYSDSACWNRFFVSPTGGFRHIACRANSQSVIRSPCDALARTRPATMISDLRFLISDFGFQIALFESAIFNLKSKISRAGRVRVSASQGERITDCKFARQAGGGKPPV